MDPSKTWKLNEQGGKSYQDATNKAEQFADRNEQETRVKAKQAIVTEISSQLQLRADRMRLISRPRQRGDGTADSPSHG